MRELATLEGRRVLKNPARCVKTFGAGVEDCVRF